MHTLKLLPIVVFLPFMMATQGQGCGAEYQAGDGDAAAWPIGPVPRAETAPRPMSTDWIEKDNCWKQMVASVETCMGDDTDVGQFDAFRETCEMPAGHRLDLGGPISTPAAGTTTFVGVEWRLLNQRGNTCATGKFIGVGRTILDVLGQVALMETPTVTSLRLTCPDGKTYANDVEGVHPQLGLEWLAHRTPGVLLTCEGKRCTLSLWGGPEGEHELAVCE